MANTNYIIFGDKKGYRKEKLHKIQVITNSSTLAKALDKALDITLNIYENRTEFMDGRLTPQTIKTIIGSELWSRWNI